MISWIAASLMVCSFLVLINAFTIIENSRKVIAVSRESVQVLTSKELDDLSKEKQLQRMTVLLFKLFFLITIGSVAAVFIPAALIWLFHLTGIGSWGETLAVILSWPFITASSVIGCGAFYFMSRKNIVKAD